MDIGYARGWQVTLGGNRSIVFNNLYKGQEFTVVLVQDDSGNRSVTWPSNVRWQSRKAPTLKAAANAVDVFTFKYDGTYVREVSGGGGARLPEKVTQSALTTMLAVGASALTAVTISLSGGSGEGPGDLPSAIEVKANSGSQLLFQVNGSGSVFIGGSGSLTLDAVKQADNAFGLCIGSGGVIGYMTSVPDENGIVDCVIPVE
jgi:hypothetical protein